jgi:hypothetical protein
VGGEERVGEGLKIWESSPDVESGCGLSADAVQAAIAEERR